MNLFKKALKIHVSRLNGEYVQYDSDQTLIEQLFKDGSQKFPALIFNCKPDQCCKENQVKPTDKGLMLASSGEFTIVETPGVSATTLAIISIVLSVASAAYAIYTANKYSDSSTTDTSSENRTLSSRQNSAKPLKRIEDRAGENLIYPTLIQRPYTKFYSKKEVEISLMCLGIGEFDYDHDYVKDGNTALSIIDTESACFYAPDVMPGDSANAEAIVGDSFNEEVKTVYQSDEVDGSETLPTVEDITLEISGSDMTMTVVDATDYLTTSTATNLTYLNDADDQYYALDSDLDLTGTSYDIDFGVIFSDDAIDDDGNRYCYVISGMESSPAVITNLYCKIRLTYVDEDTQYFSVYTTGSALNAVTKSLFTGMKLNQYHEMKLAMDSSGDSYSIYLDGTYVAAGAIGAGTDYVFNCIGGRGYDSSFDTFYGSSCALTHVTIDGEIGFNFTGDNTSTEITNSEDGGVNNVTLVNIDSGDAIEFALNSVTSPTTVTPSLSTYTTITIENGLYPDFDTSSSSLIGVKFGLISSSDEGEIISDYASAGDTVYLSGAKVELVNSYTGHDDLTYSKTLGDDYFVVEIGDDYLVVSTDGSYGTVTDLYYWYDLDNGNYGSTPVTTFKLKQSDSITNTYIGPYFLGGDDRDSFFANFVFASGLIADNGSSQTVSIAGQYAQCDSLANMTGSWIDTDDISLSAKTYSKVGVTLEVDTSFSGPMLFRCRRTTKEQDGVDDVILDSLFGASPIDVADFGNVTTVQTRTVAKGAAAQISDRNFNMIGERKLPLVQSDGTLGTENTATSRFIDYFAYCCTNSKIGRQSSDDVDYQELHDQYTEIVEYFDDTDSGEFCYTFDDDQVSFQDHLEAIAGAVFSIPIRTGTVISSDFEQPSDPRTLFTHRNKMPGQQTITRTFHADDRIDGIEFEWVNPDSDDEPSIIYIPSDYSAEKPEKIESIGVRNYNQAYWLAHRAYNKIINQRVAIDDTLTAEAQLLNTLNVVAIVDDTKAPYYSGEIVGVSGLTLTLNQPVAFVDDEDHSISLRQRDGTIEIIGCAAGSSDYQVVLDSAPSETPYTGIEATRTVFTFQQDTGIGDDYYVISKITRDDPNEIPISGYNYSENFYSNDSDTPS